MKRLVAAPARLLLLLLLSGAFLLPASYAGAGVKVDKKGKRVQKTTTADWYRHKHSDKYYTEAWVSVLMGENGERMYVTFLYSNIGVVSGNTAVNVVYAPPGKSAEHFRWEYGTGDYAENPSTGRIVIGPHSMTMRDRELKVKVKEKGFQLALKMKAWTDGVKFHDGKVYVDDAKEKFFQTFFHIPRGAFEAQLTRKGKTITFKGDGYLDHSVQTELSTDFTSHWWTLRVFTPTHAVCFVSFRTTEERGGDFVMRAIITDRSKVLAFTDKLKLKYSSLRKDPKGHRYHTRFQVDYKGDGITLEGVAKGGKLHDREAFMENLNAVERMVAKAVAGNPIVYRIDGDVKMTLTPDGGEPIPIEGTGLMETIVMEDDE